MGNIDDVVPFFGRTFNKIYPLIMVVYTLLVAGNFFEHLMDFCGSLKRFKCWTYQEEDMDGLDPSGIFILQKGRNCMIYLFLLPPHILFFRFSVLFLWGFRFNQWTCSCIGRVMYLKLSGVSPFVCQLIFTKLKIHLKICYSFRSIKSFSPQSSFFPYFSLEKFILLGRWYITWCILHSSSERNLMEQGRKVSEHATPLARNVSCIGKDVESGNVPSVRILASSVPFLGAILFPPGQESAFFFCRNLKF